MPSRNNQLSKEGRARADKRLEAVLRHKAKHPERVRESSRKTYRKYAEIYRAKRREYSIKNKKRELEYSRLYHASHKESEAAYQRGALFRAYVRKWEKQHYANNPGLLIRRRLKNRLNKLLNCGKGSSILNLIGCSLPELKAHIESQFRDGMSWDKLGQIHIDHIRPCASFDLTDIEQQRACFNFRNLQPLWAKENHKKGACYDGN